jgi:hypothetical protein
VWSQFQRKQIRVIFLISSFSTTQSYTVDCVEPVAINMNSAQKTGEFGHIRYRLIELQTLPQYVAHACALLYISHNTVPLCIYHN